MTAGECKWLARLGRLPPLRRRLRARSRHRARVMSGPRRLLPGRRAEPRRRPRHCPGAAVSPVSGSHPGTFLTLNPDGAGPAHAQGHHPRGHMASALRRDLICPAVMEELQLRLPSLSGPAATRRTPRHLQDPASLIPALSSSDGN